MTDTGITLLSHQIVMQKYTRLLRCISHELLDRTTDDDYLCEVGRVRYVGQDFQRSAGRCWMAVLLCIA